MLAVTTPRKRRRSRSLSAGSRPLRSPWRETLSTFSTRLLHSSNSETVTFLQPPRVLSIVCLCVLQVCLQANSHELLDPDTLILNKSQRSRSLYGIDEGIVPRIDTDDDVAHPLFMEINQDGETILQVEDINVNGDTIETVVDEPAEEISGITGVALADNVNVAFEPQDVGAISEEEDPEFRLYVIQLANLLLAREITDLGKVAIVAPSFLTGYTATQTPAVLGFGNIYEPVNAIVSGMWTGATDMGATLPAPITADGTPQIFPWQQQLFGAPFGYPKVPGYGMVAVPPVPPNAYGAQQNYLQQQLYKASFSPFGPPALYPQINGAIMPPIRPVPPLGLSQQQFYGASSSPFGAPTGYAQINDVVKLPIPQVSPNAYGPQQGYQQQPLFGASSSPFGPEAGYSQVNAALQQSHQQPPHFGTPSAQFGPMAGYLQVNAALQHPIPPVAPYAYGPQQSLQQQPLYGASSAMLGTLSSLDMLLGYPEVGHATEAAFAEAPLTAINVPQTYIQEQPYSVTTSLLDLMLDYPYDVSIDTFAISPPSPATFDVPQTHLRLQQYGAPFPQEGYAGTVAIPTLTSTTFGAPQLSPCQKEYYDSFSPFSMMQGYF